MNKKSLRNEKPVKKSVKKPQESWAGAVRAIGVAAVHRGQLVHFGLILVALMLLWRLESKDLMGLLKLIFTTGWVSNLGWVFFLGMTAISGTVITAQRKIFMAEIDRLSVERTHWQKQSNNQIKPSDWQGS